MLPEHQRKGMGRRLLEFAEARSRALRRPEIRLFTNAKMVRNIALYQSLGYAETRREESSRSRHRPYGQEARHRLRLKRQLSQEPLSDLLAV